MVISEPIRKIIFNVVGESKRTREL